MKGSDNPLGGESTIYSGQDQTEATDDSLPVFTFPADFNPAELPTRQWIILGRILRGYISVCVAPAGVGKTMFALIYAIMVATGKSLFPVEILETTNVLFLNNEDDEIEMKRRVAASCLHYEIPFSALTGKFFGLSGYGHSFLIAQRKLDNTVIAAPAAAKIINFCRSNKVGLLVVDPFVSTHDLSENDNTEIEKVISEYRLIAKETGAAILLIHHTRKIGNDSEAHAGDVEASRGASSLIGAARIAFTLSRMSKETAAKLGIDWRIGNRLVRLDDGKTNFTQKSEEAEWYQLVSVELPNDDAVGVPVPFDMSDINKQAEKLKAEKTTEQNEIRTTEIAEVVARCMTATQQPQPEVIGLYRAETNKGKTAANDAFVMLPVGKENSISIFVDKVRTTVWRERKGTDKRFYYWIHKMEEN
jgi:RecA-family ATPase